MKDDPWAAIDQLVDDNKACSPSTQSKPKTEEPNVPQDPPRPPRRQEAPVLRVVVADSRSPRDGRFIEKIGTYDPMMAKDSPQARRARPREGQGLDRQGRPADRPRAALPRCRRRRRAPGPQQPGQGRSRQEGPGARREEGRQEPLPRPKPRRELVGGATCPRSARFDGRRVSGMGRPESLRATRRRCADRRCPPPQPSPIASAGRELVARLGRSRCRTTPRSARRLRRGAWPQGRGAAEILHRRAAGDRQLRPARSTRPGGASRSRSLRQRRTCWSPGSRA